MKKKWIKDMFYSFAHLKHIHSFEMMRHLYFRRYKLFNYEYVHIIKLNVLHLNKDFFFSCLFFLHRWPNTKFLGARRAGIYDSRLLLGWRNQSKQLLLDDGRANDVSQLQWNRCSNVWQSELFHGWLWRHPFVWIHLWSIKVTSQRKNMS